MPAVEGLPAASAGRERAALRGGALSAGRLGSASAVSTSKYKGVAVERSSAGHNMQAIQGPMQGDLQACRQAARHVLKLPASQQPSTVDYSAPAAPPWD